MDVKTIRPILILCGCLFGLVMVACTSQPSSSNPAESADPTNNTETSASTTTPASPLIVGTWYGKASLDMTHVQQRYDSLSNTFQREDFRDMINSFLSTEMAARYDGTGLMELDVQIQPVGQPIARGSARGKWRILENTPPNSVLIETAEHLPNGLQSVEKVRYTFGPGGNVAYMVAGVNELLADCKPMIVFERISESNGQLANQPGSNGSFR